MASAALLPPYSSTLTLPKTSPFLASLSTSPIAYSKYPIFRSLTLVPPQGLAWNGLRQNGFSISLKSFRLEKRGKRGGKGVFASLFGVGAPEALVIGVVALLVFGPKGLAEIAKNLGKTLRAFQPTIRELQEVSREFKSTLEKEIGLDELQNSARGNTTLSSSPPSTPPPEKSWATAEEIAAAAVRDDDSLATATPVSDTNEDSQAMPASPAAVTEDSQATPAAVTEDSQATPAAVTEDSQATPATPAAITEDSQATPATPTAINEDSPSPRATTNGDSQAVATTPAATANDSQPTFNSN